MTAKNRYHKGKICLDCGGSGKMIIRRLDPMTNEISDHKINCLKCAGMGWVKNYG